MNVESRNKRVDKAYTKIRQDRIVSFIPKMG